MLSALFDLIHGHVFFGPFEESHTVLLSFLLLSQPF